MSFLSSSEKIENSFQKLSSGTMRVGAHIVRKCGCSWKKSAFPIGWKKSI